MAERLMKKYLKDNGINDVKVSSKGLYATGENINENAKIVLKKFKALSSNRKSVKLNKIDKETLYIVMEEQMIDKIGSKNVLSMRQIMGNDVIDPYGQSEEVYYKTAEQLIKANEKIIHQICKWREK
jgi:protein-tyrosine-phosphatase